MILISDRIDRTRDKYLGGIMLKRGLIAYLMIALMGGCSSKPEEKTAEQLCSSSDTYNELTKILSGAVLPALRMGTEEGSSQRAKLLEAASVKALHEVTDFSTPQVSDSNKETKRVSCDAVMRVTMSKDMVSDTDIDGLDVSSFDESGMNLKVSYTIQPSADGNGYVYTLTRAQRLAQVAAWASASRLSRMAQNIINDQDAAAGISADEPTEEQRELYADVCVGHFLGSSENNSQSDFSVDITNRPLQIRVAFSDFSSINATNSKSTAEGQLVFTDYGDKSSWSATCSEDKIKLSTVDRSLIAHKSSEDLNMSEDDESEENEQ